MTVNGHADVVLRAEGLRAGYRENEVLHGVDLTVPTGAIVALLGHNGAGKTTFMRTVFGLHRASGGTVSYEGRVLRPGAPYARVQAGVALVPQTGNIFPSLSVVDNLRFAMESGPRGPRASLQTIFEIFPALEERPKLRASMLSGGQRQMLGVSLALIKQPTLLLLDEPSLGIAPNLVQRLMQTLVLIRDRLGTSILIVDQAVRSLLAVADHAYVMKMGAIAASAPAGELRERSDLWELF